MIRDILTTLRWLISLGAKFMRVAPVATMTVVLATLISQVSQLLAFFLPLKVIILLGSDGMPRYFPQSWAAFDRDVLIVWLCVATLVFYVLHLVAERIIAFGTGLGTHQLLARSQKVVLFENQDELAAKGYQRYSHALASGVFVVLALAVLTFVYSGMALILSGFIAGVLALVWIGYALSGDFRISLAEHLTAFINVTGAIGFLLAFAYLVVDFLFFSPPGLLTAIVALILSRQVFTRTGALISGITGLNQQQQRLDALFFHGKVFLAGEKHDQKSLWPLLEPGQRETWIGTVLDELAGGANGPIRCHWLQTGVPNVVAFHAECPGNGKAYLIKLFDLRRKALALHEATLLMQAPDNLPALEFLGATRVRRFQCHLFALPPIDFPEARGFGEVADRVRAAVMASEPPAEVVRRYTRSRPLLWQNLNVDMLERLELAAEGEALVDLERLGANLNALCRQLEALPLSILNPNVGTGSVVVAEDRSECLLNWSQWSLEPVGAGWPISRLPKLGGAFAEAAEKRPSLSHVELRQVELAALAYALERAFKRQRYSDALALLPELLQRLEEGE